MQQIKMLNTKMDQLIKILTPNAPVEKATKLEKKVVVKTEVKSSTKEKAKAKIKVVAKKASAKKKK